MSTMPVASAKASMSIATFAGGCLWCLQPPYDELARRAQDDARLHGRNENKSDG